MAFKLLSLLTATLPVFTSLAVAASISDSSLETHVNSLALENAFNPVKDSYWTGYPHHRRTPFALSPDGKTAYLAYLDQSETGVHVQQVDPTTFAATGTTVTVAGAKEAGGLVAHNDGFALLTNEALPSGTANAPAGSTPVPVLYRYTGGQQTFKTFLGGPGVHESFGLGASPDLNGDLVYSESAKLYGAYFVITAYTGNAAGHFGDSVQYVNDAGELQNIAGATSSWGCSHNTGIAFAHADAAPFASVCAEDHGAIWLNTKTQSMNGVKISNENVTNGASNEPMGGMSGSYSSLARFPGADNYIFSWVSRGAVDLKQDAWMGGSNTQATARTVNRNVAIAYMSDKYTLAGPQAISQVGAKDGDLQVNWITQGTADTSNVHVAALDATNAIVTWEEIAQPTCPFVAMGCKGAYTGSYFQLVADGQKLGTPVKSTDVQVAGDIVRMADGRVCWPYVSMDWKLDGPIRGGASTQQMSFACLNLDGAAPAPQPPTSTVAATEPSSSSVEAPFVPAPTSADAPAPPLSSTPGAATPVTSSAVIEDVGAAPGTLVLPPTQSIITLPTSSVEAPVVEIQLPSSSVTATAGGNACSLSSASVGQASQGSGETTTTVQLSFTTFKTVVVPEQASAVDAVTRPSPIPEQPAPSLASPSSSTAATTTSTATIGGSGTPTAAPVDSFPLVPPTAPAGGNASIWTELTRLLTMLQDIIGRLQNQPAQA